MREGPSRGEGRGREDAGHRVLPPALVHECEQRQRRRPGRPQSSDRRPVPQRMNRSKPGAHRHHESEVEYGSAAMGPDFGL